MTTTTSPSSPAAEVWFLTGSQGLYGPETLDQVAQQSRGIAEALGGALDAPVQVVWKPVLLDAGSIQRAMLDANSAPQCVGVVAWMHTFSPAKMWIAGLDALRKPLLHLHTQAGVELPWSTIDMDFMNLNQAAHGDREFGYIQSRLGVPRKTVAGHVSRPGRRGAGVDLGAGVPRPGRDPHARAGAVRRQHAQRRRHRGRQGGGAAAVRRLGQHLRRQRPGGRGRRRARPRRRRARGRVRRHLPGGARAARRRRAARVAA